METNPVTFTSTDLPVEKTAQLFEIHLQHGFDNSMVNIWLDGRKVFQKTITTNDVLSLAEISRLDISSGKHYLYCQVEDQQIETTFQLTDTLVVAVYRDFLTNMFKFSFYEPPYLPLYD